MGNRPRLYEKDRIYFVTNHCINRMFLMRPDPESRRIILGQLARSRRKCDIHLYGYIFMSNHFHMMVRAPKLNLSEFMCHFQSGLARELNRLRGWSGSFWKGRFSAIPLLDEPIAMEKLVYVMTNPCEADLVARPGQWPGLSSYGAMASGEDVVGLFLDRTELRKRNRGPNNHCEPEECLVPIPLPLTPLPHLADKPDWRRRTVEAVDRRARRLAKLRRADGSRVAGPKKVLAMDPFSRPDKELDGGPEPLCLASDPREALAYRKMYRRQWSNHRAAVQKWQTGKLRRFKFPEGMFPPGFSRPIGGTIHRPEPVPRPWGGPPLI